VKSVLATRWVAILLVLISVSGLRLQAQTVVNWTASGSGNWNTGANWSGGVVPNNGGGKTYNVTISPGTAQTVSLNLNATVTDLTLGATSGSVATLQSVASDSLTIAAGGNLTVDSTGILLFNTAGSNITVDNGGTLTNHGTFDLDASGDTLKVSGTTTNASGATLNIENGSAATFTGNVNNSGTFQTGFSAGKDTVTVTGTFANASGATLALDGSGDAVNINALSNSGTLTIKSGATLTITGGGNGVTDVVAGSTYNITGVFNVKNGSTITAALAKLNSIEGVLNLDGTSIAVTPTSGTLTIASGGQLSLSNASATTTSLSITGSVNNSGNLSTGFAGGTNTVTVSSTFTNEAAGVLEIYGGAGNGAGTDLVNIATLSNSGTVTLAGTGSTLGITGTGTLTNSGNINLTQGTVKFNSATATLTGGGTVTLGNSTGTETGVIRVGSSDTGTLTNLNNTITGNGNLGNGTLTLVNKGTIDGNGKVTTGTLTVQPGSGNMTNTGVLEATNGGTLILEGTYNNAGGKIEALGESSGTVNATVQLKTGTVINGGALTTSTVGSNSGIIEGTGAVTLNGVTNSGTYAINAGTTTTLEGTITNSGSVTLTGSTLSLGNIVTLNGAGKVILSNSASNQITGATSGLTLTNASTIEGSGTISNLGIVNTGTILANQSTPLIILPSSSHLNNKGTLSVSAGDTMEIGTSTGGALSNFSGTTLTGGTYTVSGTLEFGASGTSIVTDAANITLSGAGAKIVDFASQNVLTDLATITSAGSFSLSSGANFTTAGSFTNDGALTVNSGSKFTVISSHSLTNFSSSTDTLTGGTFTVGGTLLFAGANVVTDAANITLDGTGEIENSTTSKNGLANLATIAAAGSFTLASNANFTTVGNLTNNGKLTVNSRSALTVTGDLTNFNISTKTLTSGTYTVGGTLEFTGANIVTNAANLTITGTAAKILNGTANGLANFASNAGTLTLAGDGTLTTGSTAFTDSGAVTVTAGSTLTVGGSNSYTQSSGTTTVDGTLSASAIDVTGGKILGAGKLNGSVTVGGGGSAPTISVGDSGKAGLLAITGNYTQMSTATMNAFIGGTAVGTQYSQLQVTGTASLAGTLTVTLATGFTPAIGSTFTVLKAGTVKGTFSNSTIAINGSEHFAVSYTSTGVVLTVVSGAASKPSRLPHSTLATTVPTKRQPLLIAGLRHGIGWSPESRSHIFTSGTESRGFSVNKFEGPNRLSVHVATWEHGPSNAVPSAQVPESMERVSQSARSSDIWNEPPRRVSALPAPLRGMPLRRVPVNNLRPMLPRLGR
jgi:fibronectin-binding autotransporter adhesin